MSTIRNFINIIGITPEDELPNENKGEMIIYSDIETLFIPEDKPAIKNIYEIKTDVTLTSSRAIETPAGKIIILDGRKNFEIIYSGNDGSNTANILTLNYPYNSFFELPIKHINNYSKNIFILDAYFHLIESRKIYCHIIYLVNVDFENKKTGEKQNFN
jgi:hypothetical protein